MAKSREVKVAVVGDASQLQREMQKARASMGDFGAATDRARGALGSFLLGGAAIIGAKKLIDAAAELEQAVGGTAAVFGTAANKVSDFAKNAAQLSGLSESTARVLTSRLGASLKGLGLNSEEAADQAIFLTKTGADLAATLGGTTEEAVTALAATLRGEYDPIERYIGGLKASTVAAKAVSMGLAENANDVSGYAKAQATLALITENSAFAQGAFVRESETASGALAITTANAENAAAKLGKSLLPIYTKLTEVAGSMAKAFGELPAPVQTALIAFTGVAVAIRPVTETVRALSDVTRAVIANFDKYALRLVNTESAVTSIGKTQEMLGTQTTNVASTFSRVTAALGVAGVAIGAATILWSIYSQEQAAAKKAAKEFKDTLDPNTGAITANTTALFRQQLEDNNRIDNLAKAGISVEKYTAAIADNTGEIKSSTTALAIEGIKVQGSVEARTKLAEKIRAEGGARNELIATLLEQGQLDSGLLNQIKENTKTSEANTKAIRDKARETAISAGKTKEEADAAADAAVEAKRQADAIAELNDQMRKKIDLLLESANGQINLEQTGISARKAIAEFNAAVSDGTTNAQERREAELGAQEAILRVASAAVQAAEDQKGAALTAAEAQAVQVYQLARLAGELEPGSPLRTYIEQYIAKLNEIKPNVNTTVTVDAQQAIDRINAINHSLTNFLSNIGIRIPSNFFPSLDQNWSGGPVNRNVPSIVGEKGPELFVPSTYGRIVDAFGTNKMMNGAGQSIGMSGGQTVNVTINTVTGDAMQIEKVVIDAIARANRRGMTSLVP